MLWVGQAPFTVCFIIIIFYVKSIAHIYSSLLYCLCWLSVCNWQQQLPWNHLWWNARIISLLTRLNTCMARIDLGLVSHLKDWKFLISLISTVSNKKWKSLFYNYSYHHLFLCVYIDRIAVLLQLKLMERIHPMELARKYCFFSTDMRISRDHCCEQ